MTERSHITILREMLSDLSIAEISHIMDAGSGRASLSTIISSFPKASVDAIVYPGDERKMNTIRDMQSDQVVVVEQDICETPIPAHYDLVVAHLLLGEASKFGNTFHDLLQSLLSIQSRYYIIIDYLEDPAVDADAIRTYCESVDLKVRKYICEENLEPQIWDDFIGTHNFGFLIEREKANESESAFIFSDTFDSIQSSNGLHLEIIEKNQGDDVILPFYWYDIYMGDKPVGKISIRIGDNYHSYYNGHVGYEVDPENRGHRYSLEALKLVLPVAKHHGMERIYLTCDQSNEVSRRIIELSGAKLLEIAKVPRDYFAWREGIEDHCIYQLDIS